MLETNPVINPSWNIDVKKRAFGSMCGLAFGTAMIAPYATLTTISSKHAKKFFSSRGLWNDATSMAYILLDTLTTYEDYMKPKSISHVVSCWSALQKHTSEAGIQTEAQTVSILENLSLMPSEEEVLKVRDLAYKSFSRMRLGKSSITRLVPLTLQYLYKDDSSFIETITRYTSLLYKEPEIVEANILWLFTVRHAILTGELVSPTVFLDKISVHSRDRWASIIHKAETNYPTDFPHSNYIVTAFQKAWSATVWNDTLLSRVYACVRGAAWDNDSNIMLSSGSIIGSLAGALTGPEGFHKKDLEAMHSIYGHSVHDIQQKIDAVSLIVPAGTLKG